MRLSEPRCSYCGEPVGSSLGGSVCAACLFEGVLVEPDSADNPFAQPAAEFPKRFGPYELLDEVGRGGMGVIYRARQSGLDRVIALKMLLAGEFADEIARKRLLREARAVARLSHPNIVSIHEVGEHEGRPYFAMEYISGHSLARIIHSGPLSIARIAELISKLAQAVHYAHTQGVIHRDLKPANVLVDERDEPKLTDFGLTKTAVDLTQTMASAGSPNFMAPEQASRERGPTGVHTDVFGLGAILYFLLTGQSPAPGEMLGETLRAVLGEDPVPPRNFRRDTPPDLETICLKCLRKAPSERYASALELAEDLGRFLRLEPIRARPVGVIGRLARWSQRNPALAALFVTIVAALIATTFQWRRARAGEYSARQNAYAAQMLLAQQRYESFNVGGALDILNELRPTPGEPDFRGFEWSYLYRLCHQEQKIIPVEGRDVHIMQFSPSGKYLVAAVSDRPPFSPKIQLFDPLTAEKVSDFSLNELRFTISPDEKWAAAIPRTNIVIRHFPSGVEHKVLAGHHLDVSSVAFSPDNQTLVSGGADQMLRLWDVSTGELLRAMPANTNRGPFCVAWDRDGRRIFSGGDDGLVYIFDAASGRVLSQLRGHSQFVYCLALSPDGQTLATGSGDHEIMLWNTETGQKIAELQGHASTIYGIAFSPDGTQLASAGWDNSVRLWDIHKKGEIKVFRGSRSFVFSVAYSPDGKTIASGGHDGTIRLWNPKADLTQKLLVGASNEIGSVQWSPQGNWLLTTEWMSGKRHVSRVWDFEKAQLIRSWESVGIRRALNADRVFLPGTNNLPVLFDPRTGAEEPLPLPISTELVVDFRYSPDRKRIATVHENGRASLWENPGSSPLMTAPIAGFAPGADASVQFSPDSRCFITTSPEAIIQIWDAGTGRLRSSFPRGAGSHSALEISPNSRLLVALDSDGYHIWELETGRRPFLVPKGQTHPTACFSPDSQSLLTGQGAIFELRDAQTGRIRHTLKGHHGSALVSTFSPDGRRIATAGDDHTIKIWDADNGRELLSIPGHQTEAHCLAFSADGRHLASCGRDRTIRIASAATLQEINQWGEQDRNLASGTAPSAGQIDNALKE